MVASRFPVVTRELSIGPRSITSPRAIRQGGSKHAVFTLALGLKPVVPIETRNDGLLE
jgi:hypothetical protein